MSKRVPRAIAGAAICCTSAITFGVGTVEAEPEVGPTCSSDLTLWNRAGQVVLALVDDPADAEPALKSLRIGGFAPVGTIDDAERDELERLMAINFGRFRPLLASDEEGGTVQRFGDVLQPLPSAATQRETMSTTEVREMYEAYAGRLRPLRVGMVFAPVVDVGAGPAIGTRSYGDDPAVVVDYARAVISGYQTQDIVTVLKHFPGHGRASTDTHDGLATTPPLDELRASDLIPFVELLGDDELRDTVAVMVGHLDVPGLTDGEPASLSSAAITGLLREELGFDGLVVSDALGMGAIRQVATVPDAAVRFLAAGGDLAIISVEDADDVHAGIRAALEDGRLPEARLNEAVERVLQAKGVKTGCAAAPESTVAESPDPAVGSLESIDPPPAEQSWSEVSRRAMIGAIEGGAG